MEEKHSLLVDHLTTGYFVHAGEIKHERIYLSQCKHIQSFCVGQLSEEETAESDTTEHTSDPSNRFVIYTTGKSPYVVQYSLSSLTKNTNITEYATNIVKGVFNVMSYLSPSLSPLIHLDSDSSRRRKQRKRLPNLLLNCAPIPSLPSKTQWESELKYLSLSSPDL